MARAQSFLHRGRFKDMKHLLFVTLLSLPAALCAQTVAETGARMAAVPCFSAHAVCEIYIPNSERPVIYDMDMYSSAAPGDTLAACDYLIDWHLTTPAGTESRGFTSYAAGDHFRYREGRLQEYHHDADPVPFAPGGDVAKGVQSRAQFAAYLPQTLGRALMAMSADTAYTLTCRALPGRIVVSGKEQVRGYDVRELTYTVDAATYMPLSVEINANPGQPAEQLMTIAYSGVTDSCAAITTARLARLYPDAFGKYRTDSYKLENMPGRRMPTFTAPTPTGERFTYNEGDAMGRPTVIAVLDSSVGDTASVVAELRRACALSSVCNRLILAFVDSDAERIEGMTGPLGLDEAILMGARSLARDCGVADTPSLIFCTPAGVVSDILIGRNNNLGSSVIQKIAISNN